MVTELPAVVAVAEPALSVLAEEAVRRRPSPEKWSKKEILGHLIDSAANNHQRLIRMQLEPRIGLPGYEQDGWVRVNRYQDAPWHELVTLWAAYNRHLAVVIQGIDPGTLGHLWDSPYGEVTLEFVASDYVGHLRHHLRQMGVEA